MVPKKINKKILIYIYVALVISVMIFLVLLNLESFIETTKRFMEVFNITNVKCFFEAYLENSNIVYEEIVDEVTTAIVDGTKNLINNFTSNESLLDRFLNFLSNFMILLCDFVINFANIGMNALMLLFIYFNETFTTTHLNTKKTLGAKIYLFIFSIIKKVITFINLVIQTIIRLISRHRRFIALNIIFIILANGILYKVLVEAIIFIAVYIYKAIIAETYILIFSFFKYIVVILYPYLKVIPYYIYIPLIMIVLFLIALSKANYRLLKNHERLKKLVQEDITQTTFINGPPGSGKTLLNVSFSLAAEELYIEELEKKMLEHELKYPYYNFAYLRQNPNSFPREHESYIEAYNYLQTRKSYIISNYAIYSPYFCDFSKIFDFNFMRKNKQTKKYALEEYIVISLSELDKEYNSHDDKKRVGKDGAATFFSTVSHDLKRHVKIFCDYQLKDQVPLRIRGNSEYFYTIHERKKKYPFLLGLYYLPIKALSNLFRNLITKYETKRPFINKNTKRKTISSYKRNDQSMLYIILRQLSFSFNKLSNFFDHYWYFRIKGDLSMRDGEVGEKKNICLNICDLSIENMALYDSTFLSYAYEQKKNMAFKDLDKFSSLTPSIDELNKCNSHFYNQLNGQEVENIDTEDINDNEDDDIIIVNN